MSRVGDKLTGVLAIKSQTGWTVLWATTPVGRPPPHHHKGWPARRSVLCILRFDIGIGYVSHCSGVPWAKHLGLVGSACSFRQPRRPAAYLGPAVGMPPSVVAFVTKVRVRMQKFLGMNLNGLFSESWMDYPKNTETFSTQIKFDLGHNAISRAGKRHRCKCRCHPNPPRWA